MLLKEMYVKKIDRDIRGVIKADQTDEADVYQELDEYVVTRELHKHFAKFYDHYLKGIDGKTDKVGVWISGFFGSGKSHFLKILAYLLENKEVKGMEPIDFFADKIIDPSVYANMKKTAAIPTETILFNIDSKSPLDNKGKEDAILRVLVKVFNEHRGYYGDNPVVAELEKYLDRQGTLAAFKHAYEAIAPEPWEKRRNTFAFDTHYVKEALLQATDMTGDAVDHWLSNRGNAKISIEQFAKEVKEYIDRKEADFHLVFLIDEVGQYIGDRRDLMLNLQTVTENLGAFCQGKAWVMVTSQESIDSIVKVKGDDFSRIQGRFDTRLSLSSISVDEVIQKRILDKKDFAAESLKATFPEKGPILRNLISFREATGDLSGFEDAPQFANIYPFVPYQFNLLQNVFEQVRKHGSSGKHLSEGERSMLSAYREAGTRFMEEAEGTIIPFYAFYDTIKEFLQPTVSRVIERAAENEALKDDPFHVDVLKVLFMVKYVEQMPANVDNIATLMVTHIDQDKLELKEKINHSLRKLVSQILIQKHGETYIFLTDDEQDINREIKALTIEEDRLKKNVAEYIFEDLYDTKKYSYSKMYDFAYNQKMDEKHYGSQTASIGVHILSPLSEDYHQSDQEMMMKSSGTNEIIIRLAGDGAYVEEIEEALKIEEYRHSRNISQLPENMQNILNSKQAETRERRRRGRDLLEDALKQASYFMNGNKIEVRGSTVREKMNAAFKQLVENVYTYLPLMQEFTMQESDLKAYLTADNEQLADEAMGNPNGQARHLVDEYIRLQTELNQQIRMKPLYDRFHHVPYGWRELDIAKIIATLLREQHIRIRYHAQHLEPVDDANTLMTVFTQMNEADKAIVLSRQKVDEGLIRTVRRITRELFDKSDLANDEDGLIRDIRSLIEKTESEIHGYMARYEGRKYPGMSLLDKGLEHFSKFNKSIDNLTFFTNLKNGEDDLADWFDDVHYVKSFFGTNQQGIYDNGIRAIRKYEETKNYVGTEAVAAAMEQLSAILHDPIPYRKIKDIPKLVHTLDEEMKSVLNTKRAEAREKIQFDYDETSLQANHDDVSSETKAQVDREYMRIFADLDAYTDIYKVDAAISQSQTFKMRAIDKVKREIKAIQLEREAAQRNGTNGGDAGNPPVIVAPVMQKEKVRLSELISVTTLATEDDVDKYISTLHHKLKQIILSNKEIEIND
jgi:hypothetical protein